MQQFDGRTERINITLPRRLLVKIDAFISGIRSSAPEAPFLPRQHCVCCLEDDQVLHLIHPYPHLALAAVGPAKPRNKR